EAFKEQALPDIFRALDSLARSKELQEKIFLLLLQNAKNSPLQIVLLRKSLKYVQQIKNLEPFLDSKKIQTLLTQDPELVFSCIENPTSYLSTPLVKNRFASFLAQKPFSFFAQHKEWLVPYYHQETQSFASYPKITTQLFKLGLELKEAKLMVELWKQPFAKEIDLEREDLFFSLLNWGLEPLHCFPKEMLIDIFSRLTPKNPIQREIWNNFTIQYGEDLLVWQRALSLLKNSQVALSKQWLDTFVTFLLSKQAHDKAYELFLLAKEHKTHALVEWKEWHRKVAIAWSKLENPEFLQWEKELFYPEGFETAETIAFFQRYAKKCINSFTDLEKFRKELMKESIVWTSLYITTLLALREQQRLSSKEFIEAMKTLYKEKPRISEEDMGVYRSLLKELETIFSSNEKENVFLESEDFFLQTLSKAREVRYASPFLIEKCFTYLVEHKRVKEIEAMEKQFPSPSWEITTQSVLFEAFCTYPLFEENLMPIFSRWLSFWKTHGDLSPSFLNTLEKRAPTPYSLLTYIELAWTLFFQKPQEKQRAMQDHIVNYLTKIPKEIFEKLSPYLTIKPVHVCGTKKEDLLEMLQRQDPQKAKADLKQQKLLQIKALEIKPFFDLLQKKLQHQPWKASMDKLLPSMESHWEEIQDLWLQNVAEMSVLWDRAERKAYFEEIFRYLISGKMPLSQESYRKILSLYPSELQSLLSDVWSCFITRCKESDISRIRNLLTIVTDREFVLPLSPRDEKNWQEKQNSLKALFNQKLKEFPLQEKF
ncbi:MAG: hypothetical protein WCP39_07315, partial [Chlamydiota bacterium]